MSSKKVLRVSKKKSSNNIFFLVKQISLITQIYLMSCLLIQCERLFIDSGRLR